MLRIRTLYLAGITAVLASTGCVVGSDGSGRHSRPGAGTFDVAWELAWVEDGGYVTCQEAGAAVVDLDVVHLDSTLVYHDSFPCAAGRGRSQVLPGGDYSAVLRVYDDRDTLLSETWPAAFRLTGGTTYLSTDHDPVVMSLQSFVMYWSVTRGGAPSGCAQVGAAWVELLAQPTGAAEESSYLFPCADGRGITQAIPPGTYSVQARLLAADEKPLALTELRTAVVGTSRRAVLDPITFRMP